MDINNQFGVLGVQKELLTLLKKFCSFCESHNIKYSLAYGSLLGAIRHQGFIPWDNDLDIIVDRDNYKKIMTTINNDPVLETEKERWLDVVKLKDNSYNFNPTLDIFILDYVPVEPIIQKLKLFVISLLQGMMKDGLYMKKGNFILKISSFFSYIFGKLFSKKLKFSWYQRVSQWKGFGTPVQMACYDASYRDIRCLFKINVFEKVHYAEFEDTKALIIDEYDDFLRSRYGDYITPRQSKDYVTK